MDKGPEIRVMKNFRADSFGIFIDWYRNPDNYLTVKEPLNFVKRELYEETPPVCRLSETAAQQLMDDLWACGLRPSEGRGSAGQLAAVQEHLKDMKIIVSKKLGVELCGNK